jgi:hypothetical protein
MTKEELRDRLLELRAFTADAAHELADRALLDYIDDPEISYRYESLRRGGHT